MAELGRQGKSFQEALPIGMGLDVARAALRSKGVQFYENTEEKQGIVLNNGRGETLTASPGDEVISARFETGASQYAFGPRFLPQFATILRSSPSVLGCCFEVCAP